MNILQTVKESLQWTSLSSIFSVLISALRLGILAHYLSSEVFGLLAILDVFIRLGQSISDWGMSAAVIQHAQLNRTQLSTIWWTNIATGFTLGFLLYVIAPYVSNYYTVNLTEYILGISALFFIQSFGLLPVSLLRKNLLYKEVEQWQIFF
ncbi:MAG: oligosaccharide flippase family protein, partial [Bacteroidota bacterium]